jgi:hypothetical protein
MASRFALSSESFHRKPLLLFGSNTESVPEGTIGALGPEEEHGWVARMV